LFEFIAPAASKLTDLKFTGPPEILRPFEATWLFWQNRAVGIFVARDGHANDLASAHCTERRPIFRRPSL